jgi:diaminopimelate epimerase
MRANLPFVKMHASGNDFIVIDNRMGIFHGDLPEMVAKLCRRRYSVGADGLILIEDSALADFRWRFFNADGSEVAMCGNGSRCAARFAFMKGIAGSRLAFDTLAGIIRAEVKDDSVKVQLTQPYDYRPRLSLDVGDACPLEAEYINTGVPHVVYFVEDLESMDVHGLGARTRYHDMFAPGGTNANFVWVHGRHDMTISSGLAAAAP